MSRPPTKDTEDAPRGHARASERDALPEDTAEGAPAEGKAVRPMLSTDEIFHRVVATAEEEFSRPNRLLFLSGITAGLALSVSFLAGAAVSAAVPLEEDVLIWGLMYPVGFLIVALGQYQLFTENTLTPVTLVLTRLGSLPLLLRIWGVVLAANVVGSVVVALILSRTGVFSPEQATAAYGIAEHAVEQPWWDLFWKAVVAGALVATMVWLNHAARESTTRVLVVFITIYPIAAAELTHCIVGAIEAAYLYLEGGTSLSHAVFGFFAPAVLGNSFGGVVFVASLNYAQTRKLLYPNRDFEEAELSWGEWLFGREGSRARLTTTPQKGSKPEPSSGRKDS